MTAATVSRAARRTLAQEIAYLAVEAGKVPARDLGRILVLRLERAAGAAAVQADELDMLRAQAADRERARAALRAVSAELDQLEVALRAGRGDPSAESARWSVKRMRDLIGRGVAPPVENPRGSQS